MPRPNLPIALSSAALPFSPNDLIACLSLAWNPPSFSTQSAGPCSKGWSTPDAKPA